MSDDYKFYPEKFLSIRKKNKLEQKEIANRLGCDRNMMWRYETGRTKPSISKIKMMSDILNISSLEICSIDLSSQKYSLNKANNPDNIKNHLRFVRNIDSNVAEDLEEYINSLLIYKKSYESEKQDNIKYTEILDRISPIVYSKDIELKYTQINRPFLDLITPGKRKIDIIGKSNTQILSKHGKTTKLPKDFNEIKEMEIAAINLGTEQSKNVIKIPGIDRIGNIKIVPLFDNYNKVYEIIVTINDNTVQSATISQQQNYLRIIDDLNCLVWIKRFTPEPHYLFMSNSCFRLTGYSREEFMNDPNIITDKLLIDRFKNDPSIIDPDTRYFIPDKKHRVEIKTKDHKNKWCDIAVNKTTDETGNEVYYGTYTDVTDDINRTYFMQHLNSAFETAGLFIFTGIKSEKYHLPFKVNFFSSNIEAVTFCPKTEMEHDQTNIRKYIHPEYLKNYTKWINQDIAVLKTKNIITKVVNKDKTETKWLYVEIVRQNSERYCGTVIDITKEREDKNRQEAVLGAIDKMNDSFWLTKRSSEDVGENIYFNEARSKLYGRTKEELLSDVDFWTEFIHPDDLKRYEGLPYEEKIKNFSYRIILKNGEIKYVEESKFEINDKGDVYIGGVQRDITKRKENEQMLEELSEAASLSDMLIFVAKYLNPLDKDTQYYSYIGDNCEKFFNLSKEYLQNHKGEWINSVIEEDREYVTKAFTNTKHPVAIEYRVQNRGDIRWLEHKTIKKNNKIYSYINDITTRKKDENIRQLLEQVVTKNNIITWVGKFTSNKDFKYTYTCDNNSFGQNLMHPIQENSVASWFESIHPDDKEETIKLINEKTKPSSNYTYRVQLKDKSYKRIFCKVNRVFNKNTHNIEYGIAMTID